MTPMTINEMRLLPRPKGSNADEWMVFLECWGATPYSAVQIAEAMDEAVKEANERAATARAEAIREAAKVADDWRISIMSQPDYFTKDELLQVASSVAPEIHRAILALLEKPHVPAK